MALLQSSTALQLVAFVAALVALSVVADPLVDAVLELGNWLRIPPAIAGATLAAMATSAPELATNIAALWAARTEGAAANIGVGTILGSAVFNLVLIVGLVALVGRTRVQRRVWIRDGGVYAGAVALLVLLLCFVHLGRERCALTEWEGALLLLGYGGYLGWLLRDIRAQRAEVQSAAEVAGAEPRVGTDHPPVLRALAKLVGAAGLIALASHLLVSTTRLLAASLQQAMGWDHGATAGLLSVIVIAAATSAPDAFTSLAAARRGEGSMAVANALGSNTFDILVCLGLPAVFMGGRPVAAVVRLSSGFLLLGTLLVLGMGLRWPVLERRHGIFLVGFYLSFVGLIGAFFAWHA